MISDKDIDVLEIGENYGNFLYRVSRHQLSINFIQECMSRLHYKYPSDMIVFLMKGYLPHYSELSRSPTDFLKNNSKYFEKDGKMKADMFMKLKRDFESLILPGLKQEIKSFEGKKETVESEEKIKKDEDNAFVADKFLEYDTFMKVIQDGDRHTSFRYDFDNPDMETKQITDAPELQRCNIKILDTKIVFNFINKYKYTCDRCGKSFIEPVYKHISSKGKIICDGELAKNNPKTGEDEIKPCKNSLFSDDDNSIQRKMYYYIFSYENRDKISTDLDTAVGLSFKELDPGFYNAVIYFMPSKSRMPTYHIVDTQTYQDNVFDMPMKKDNENYMITFISALDDFLQKQTKTKIYGLISPKIGLIMQTMAFYLKRSLYFNVHLCGDKSTGKSMLLRYWGYMLNGGKHLSTNGLSISVPALRGTRKTLLVFGKEQKALSMGLLGVKISIHIDEAMTNSTVVEQLKTFLYEDNFSYDKADGVGAIYKRSAHVNISENFNQEHIKFYMESIKKLYKENNIKIDNKEQVIWDDDWDLYQPENTYTDEYLKKFIKEVRDDLARKKKFWIDGHEDAFHDRFPFYYFLVNGSKKDDEKFIDALDNNIAEFDNVAESLELMRVLKNDALSDFFIGLNRYRHNTDGKGWVKKVRNILEEFNIDCDGRKMRIYSDIVSFSRIINQRMTYEEEDYDMLRYILSTTNRKIDVADLAEYKLKFDKPIIKEGEKEKFGINTKIGDDFNDR